MTHEISEVGLDQRLDKFQEEIKEDMKKSGLYPESLIDLVFNFLERGDTLRTVLKRLNVEEKKLIRDFIVAPEVVECVVCIYAGNCAERVVHREVALSAEQM